MCKGINCSNIGDPIFYGFSTWYFENGYVYEAENIEATIQDFVNWSSERPEYWRYKASLAVVSSHVSISGECPN